LGKIVKILVLDDEEDSRELLGILISKYFEFPHQVIFSKSYSEAYLTLKNDSFDVVFSDSKLPNNSENKILDLITNIKTQIIISSALGIESFKNKNKRPMYFLQKPIDIDDFRIISQLVVKNLQAHENSLII